MKAKIIETGEIVTIVTKPFTFGQVTVLYDSKTFSGQRATDLEIIDEKEIDWEQRRYEIAKDALAGIIAEESVPGTDPFHYIDKDASRAIAYADELIKQLKENE